MLFKSNSSGSGCKVTGIGFTAYKNLIYPNIACLFQRFDMRGQIPIRHFEQLLQGIEIIAFIRSQNSHNLQTQTIFKSFVKMFQHQAFLRSYLKYITDPYSKWKNPNPINQNNRSLPARNKASKPNPIWI